jgi:probable rRNA maturation factor
MDEGNLFSNQRGRLPRREAIALTRHILRIEKQKLPVNIIFTDDHTLENLNSRFRKKHRPTDVLSFPADPELGIIGEIYISIDTARQQARDYNAPLREEVLRLVCHGVLHLCGYDHDSEKNTVRMQNKEKQYLDRFMRHA